MTIRQKTISIILIITVIIISCSAGLSMTDNLAHVSGESMMPALHDGDIVYGSTSHDGIERNDIIVFHDDDGWTGDDEYLIKRVIGIPGDEISIDMNGRIRVNGVLADNETGYTGGCDRMNGNIESNKFTIPANSLFVRGDNLNNSRDSRYMYCEHENKRYFISYDSVKLHVKGSIGLGTLTEKLSGKE